MSDTPDSHEHAIEADAQDREYGAEQMDASDVESTLFEIRAALEAARRGEIDDGGLQDAASDVEAIRGWVTDKSHLETCVECGDPISDDFVTEVDPDICGSCWLAANQQRMEDA